MSTEEERAYKALVGTIGGHKGYLTRLTDNVNGYLDIDEIDEEQQLQAEELRDNIKTRIGKLEGMFDELLANPHVSDDDIGNFEKYMTGIKAKCAKLMFKLKQIQPSSPGSPGPEPAKGSGWGETAIKYPEIVLPTFRGGENGVQNYRPFLQIFEALVGEKRDIPQMYKVQYFRGCLPEDSEAFKLIKHIPPTSENYELHKAILDSRYGDTTGEANRLRRELDSIKEWDLCNSIEEQRRLLDHIQQNLSLLSQYEDVDDNQMASLALNMLSRLPERIRYKAAKIPLVDRTVNKIVLLVEEGIKKKLEVKSMSEPRKQAGYHQAYKVSRDQAQTVPGPPNSQGGGGGGGAHFTNYGGQPQMSVRPLMDSTSLPPCIYCKKSEPRHNAHFCREKPSDPKKAKEVLWNQRVCFNCFDQSHSARECPHPSICKCGRGKHSPSLCYKSVRGRGSVGKRGGYSALPKESSPKFMETALAMVKNPKNGAILEARIFIDGGSTDSYGTSGFASRLGYSSDRNTIHIGTFATNDTKAVLAGLIDVTIISNLSPHRSFPVQLLTIDKCCHDLPSYKLSESEMQQLAPYPLADFPATQGQDLPIDIVIGMDYQWVFKKGGCKKWILVPASWRLNLAGYFRAH